MRTYHSLIFLPSPLSLSDCILFLLSLYLVPFSPSIYLYPSIGIFVHWFVFLLGGPPNFFSLLSAERQLLALKHTSRSTPTPCLLYVILLFTYVIFRQQTGQQDIPTRRVLESRGGAGGRRVLPHLPPPPTKISVIFNNSIVVVVFISMIFFSILLMNFIQKRCINQDKIS